MVPEPGLDLEQHLRVGWRKILSMSVGPYPGTLGNSVGNESNGNVFFLLEFVPSSNVTD